MQSPESQDYEEEHLDQPVVAWFLPNEDNDEDTKLDQTGAKAPWSRSTERRSINVKHISLESFTTEKYYSPEHVNSRAGWYWNDCTAIAADSGATNVVIMTNDYTDTHTNQVMELATMGDLYAAVAMEVIENEAMLEHLKENGVIIYNDLKVAHESINRDIFNL